MTKKIKPEWITISLCFAWLFSGFTLLNSIVLRDDISRILGVSANDPRPNQAVLDSLGSELKSLETQVAVNQCLTFVVLPSALGALIAFRLLARSKSAREISR